MFSLHGSSGTNLGDTLELVIDGAQVDSGVVSRNRNVWHLHQLVALVTFTGKFLQGILVIGQGAQLILHIHHPSLGGQAEPSASMVIPRSFVLYTVIAVCILRVKIPAGFGTNFAILVSNESVAFPSGLAGEFEGHIGEPAHVGLVALANFHELEVAANDLVVGGISVTEFDDLPVLADLERAYGLVSMQVALTRLYLLHLIGAVRQRTVLGLGNAVLDLDGSAHLTGGVESTVDVHSILGFICDFK